MENATSPSGSRFLEVQDNVVCILDFQRPGGNIKDLREKSPGLSTALHQLRFL